MKTTICTLILSLGTAAFLSGCKQQTSPASPATGTNTNVPAGSTNVLNNETARVSYAIGMSMGHTLQRQGIEVDADLVARGIKEVLTGPTLLTPVEAQATLMAFSKEFAAQQEKKRAELAATNEAIGLAFLATNKNNPGVVTLTNGLQYKVITNGTGAMPGPGDIVTVNYRGTLLDGTEFDSSFKRGQPAKFPVNRVIPGWTEALEKMKVGSRWQLFIPPELAYGQRGGPVIPPNSVLIFDVELLAKENPPSPAASSSQPLTSDIIKVPSAEEMKKGAKIEVIKPEDVKKMQQP